MPVSNINGVNLFWERTGHEGEPLVLVHGSWGDHHNWDSVVNELSENFQVLTYDRRGHSQSERLKEPGSLEQDVADLIALVEELELAPAHIAGNSGGAAVALKTAIKKPDLFQTLIVHEPPLFDLLNSVPESQPYLQNVKSRIGAVVPLLEKGENEQAAQLFVETIAMGPGAWQQLPLPVQQTFIFNAPTFLDEMHDPNNLNLDTAALSHFDKPSLLTTGTESPPFFLMVLNQLATAMPTARRYTFEGAGHVPHMSHPTKYVEVLKNFCLTNT